MIPLELYITEEQQDEEQAITDQIIDEIDKILKLKKRLAENESNNVYT
jgi:hypothetical protein